MVKSNPIFALTMQFLYPYFLWALVALTIPVIIHLFYFKRFKKVYFSNVRYLKEIKEETSNRNKIKELLILLSRLCLLYTSDAADERSSVDLGGRRIIKKKKNQ